MSSEYEDYYPRYIPHPIRSGQKTAPSDADDLIDEDIDNDIVITGIRISGDGDIRVEIETEEQDATGTAIKTSFYLPAAGEVVRERSLEEGGLLKVPGFSTIKVVCDTDTGAGEDFYVDIDAFEINCL